MTYKSIAIDMDEILTDTSGKVIDAVNFRADLGIEMEALDGRKLKRVIPEHDGLAAEVLREPGFFRHLKTTLHAQEVVKKSIEHYDVYIAMAATDVPTSFSNKCKWLLEFFPFLDPQHFVFYGKKNIVKADYLMNDNPRQLEIFAGIPTMFTAVHNINDDWFERVNNWKDVGQYFLDNIGK